MAVNKVEVNGETKLDLTQDTVTPEDLLSGVTAHNAAGNQIVGKYQSVTLTGLEITAPPEKTYYKPGDVFDPTGMVVTATFSNGEQLQPVNYQVAPAGPLTIETSQISISYTWGTVTKTAYQAISVVAVHIYGVQWDGAKTTRWTRTDDSANFTDPQPAINNGTGSSPFDNLMPWAGMVKEEDSVAGTLVKIPKYWYRWIRSGKTMKLQIADSPVEGFYTSPAHADRGDGYGERDYVYVGRYHCASDYKSKTGKTPWVNVTRATARTQIHSLGTDIYQYDYAMFWTIRLLYLCEYSDWNSQEMLGVGGSPSGRAFSMGLTDAMKYHTGTSAASRGIRGCVQYRYIEGLWDNAYDFVDGIRFSDASVYCIKNPSQFSDTANGTLVGTRTTSSGYISKWTSPTASGFEYALFPNEVNGGQTTYITDVCQNNSAGVLMCSGGDYDYNLGCGAFCMLASYGESSSNSSVGCRLQKLPNKAA